MTRPPKSELYLCFSEKDSLESAVTRFLERFDRPPLFVWVAKRMIWVGPVAKGEGDE